jgi:limonene 1,2-monooxygenase
MFNRHREHQIMSNRMRFGVFIAPFHAVRENPTLAMERDFELVQWVDTLAYDEAWIGEHHSAGFEIIASPELFIATAAERTRHIKLGTGVSSLPYHHPLMLADRINQLDHVTRGRVMFGVGPGALPSDAVMMGIDIAKQRDMMDEALDVLVPLLRGETVTKKTD